MSRSSASPARCGRGIRYYVSGTGPVGADTADAATQTSAHSEIIRDCARESGSQPRATWCGRACISPMSEDWEASAAKRTASSSATIRPAATMVVVAELLNPSWRVEIEADAVVHSRSRQ